MKPLEYTNVYVIESLRPTDTKTGTALFNNIIRRELLKKGKESNCELFIVNTKEEFIKAFLKIRSEEINLLTNPVIHFEMHGAETGIQLTNNEVVTWQELLFFLVQLNGICNNNLFVTMATCKGAYIFNTMLPEFRTPFWGFVGPFEEVKAQEILYNYSAFYEEFLLLDKYTQPSDFDNAINALNNSIPPTVSRFHFYRTEEIMDRVYTNYEKYHLTPERIEERVNEILQTLRPKPEFKNWTDKMIKEMGRNLLVERKDDMHKDFVRRFFMVDVFPDHAKYYEALK